MAIHTGRRFLHAAFSVTGVAGLTCGAQRLTSCEASQQDAWFVSIGRSLVLAKSCVRIAECWFRAAPASRTGGRRHPAHARRAHNRPPWASDNGAAHRNRNPHPGGLRDKVLQNPVAILRSDTRPPLAYRDEQGLLRARFRADHSSRTSLSVLVTASIAFTIRVSTTCCSCTRSP
jgi:hypothetical protein